MTIYAKDTSVSVAKSSTEIKELLQRYGASKFAQFEEEGMAKIAFEANERRIMFELPLPSRDAFKVIKVNTGYGHTRVKELPPEKQMKAWEQACRQKWRALALVIKAKLEAVESGISEFEDEFLSNIVLPNGKTVGKMIRPQLADAFLLKKMPPLLGSGV